MTPYAPKVFSTTEPRTAGELAEAASQTFIAGSFVFNSGGTYAIMATTSNVSITSTKIAGLTTKAAVGSGSTRPPAVLRTNKHNPIRPENTIFEINLSSGTTLTTTWASACTALSVTSLVGSVVGLRIQSTGIITADTAITTANISPVQIVGIHPSANVLGTAEPGTRVLVKIVPSFIQG